MYPTNIRRSDALRYGLFGAVTFLLYFWLAVNWLTVAAWLMGRERVIFDEQPSRRHISGSTTTSTGLDQNVASSRSIPSGSS